MTLDIKDKDAEYSVLVDENGKEIYYLSKKALNRFFNKFDTYLWHEDTKEHMENLGKLHKVK